MKPILFDILIVLILAFFAWRGAKKGLILMLCSLLGIFVAFFGARWVSAQFHEPVANIIEPPIYQSILNMDQEATEKTASAPSSQLPAATYSLEELLDMVKESDLFSGFSEFLDEAAQDNTIQGAENAARSLSHYLALLIAKAGLFALTFLVILLAWFLIGRMLDLAFKLPGLAVINWVGGVVFGLVKAVLLVMVLIWIFQLAGWIPNPPETPVVSLFTARRILALLNGLVA